MDAYERYLEYEDKIYELKDEGKWDEADKLEDEQLAIRNNEFTRKDWEIISAIFSLFGIHFAQSCKSPASIALSIGYSFAIARHPAVYITPFV